MLWGQGLILRQKNITEEPPLITGETHHSQLGGEQSFKSHSRIQESADPSRRDMEISYAGSKRCQVRPHPNQNPKSKIQTPKSKIQTPKSKIQTAPFGAATKRTKTKLIQNPKSKLQNPKSKIQNPKSKIQNPKSKIQNPRSKIQNPNSKPQNPKSKIQTPKSKLQNPKSKRPVWSLDFGFWIWSGRDRRGWLCSK